MSILPRGWEPQGRRIVGWVLTLGLIGMLLSHPALYARTRIYALLAGITGLVWLALLVRQRRAWRQFTPSRIVVWPVAIMVLSAALSILLNVDSSWEALWPLAAQLLFLWIGWWLALARGTLQRLGSGLLIGAAAAGLYAVLQYYQLDPLPVGTPFGHERVVSVFTNPNHLGNFLAGALALALAGFLQTEAPRQRAAFYVIVGFIYGGLLLSASRGAWWAGLAGCLVVIVGYARGIAGGKEMFRPVSLLVLATLLLGITLLLSQRPLIRERQGTISMSERAFSSRHILEPYVEPTRGETAGDSIVVRDATINHRYFIWQVTWEMIRSRPLFGYGYGNFQNRFTHFRDAERDGERFRTLNWAAQSEATPYAHNEYLHSWAECGILGLIGFLSLIIPGMLGAIWKAWREEGGGLYLWGALGLATVMLVHSLVSYPLRLPLNGMIFWVLFGIILRKDCYFNHEKSS